LLIKGGKRRVQEGEGWKEKSRKGRAFFVLFGRVKKKKYCSRPFLVRSKGKDEEYRYIKIKKGEGTGEK